MSKDFDKKLGAILVGLRQQRGLSQQDVGDILGMTRVGVGHWERGTRSLNVETLYRLCEIYGVENINDITDQLRNIKK